MASATPVSICSNALRKLGDDPITSLTDNTERARLCNAMYAQLRDAMMTEYNWNLAKKRQALNQISGFTKVYGFEYAFQLPTDMLLLLEVDIAAGNRWVVEGDRLLTDISSINIKYLATTADTAKMGALFIEALTARIAWELAKPITGQQSTYDRMKVEYEEKLKLARHRDATQDFPKQFIYSGLVDARSGAYVRERNKGEVDPSVGGP